LQPKYEGENEMEWNAYDLCFTENEADEEIVRLSEEGRTATKQLNIESNTWTIFVQQALV